MSRNRLGVWIVMAAALAYCVWLGWHWLPLDYSDKEFGGFVSRLWDVQREWKAGHGLPWWTPFYMSGSSYGLNFTQGMYLLPGLLLANFCSLHAAVKLTSLLAIFGGALAMYGCARHFLKNEWAAVLAAVAFMLHPEQLIRAAGAEHLGVILFMPFMPLTFWLLARTLETGRWRDAAWCALAMFGLLWSHNKMAFVHGVFLAGYVAYWFWRRRGRDAWVATARSLAMVAGLSAATGAMLIVPGLFESEQVKLLSGEREQLQLWQRNYAFKSLLGIVDRDADLTRAATTAITERLQAQAYRPTTQEQADQMRASIQRVFTLQADAPEKYTGLILLALLAVTTLWNDRRIDRNLYWFLVGMLLLSVMFACGLTTVWQGNRQTFTALFNLDGIPSSVRMATLTALAVTVAFLVVFARRKLTTPRKRLLAGLALAALLFLPAFEMLAAIPFFKEIRAPFVFYDGPGTFFAAMLAGFFVTDVAGRWCARMPVIVGAIGLLLAADYWPYEKPMKDNGVPAHTLQNLQATYASLQSDGDWVKTYSLSGRYFHLLGPMYGGKPQVYEAFYNWMCPLGTGLINMAGNGSRELFDLLAARYIVFDKTDPGMQSPQAQQMLAAYRQAFPVPHEDEDFAVFRNDSAHPYVSATTRVCIYTGDVRRSPQLALALAGKNFTLVHNIRPDRLRNVEKTYDDTAALYPPLTESAPLPLTDVHLVRESSQVIRIHLTAPSDCVAVIAESYFPFWHVAVDGKPAEVLRVNCALMGVEVPAGVHEVVLHYKVPRVYLAAAIVSLLSFVVCFGATMQWFDATRLRG